MDTMPVLYIIMYKILNFFISGINHTDNFISDFFKNVLLSNSSYMQVNINKILKEFDITYLKLFELNKLELKNIIKNKIEEPDWQCGIIVELLQMRDKQCISNLTYEEINPMLDRITTDFLGS